MESLDTTKKLILVTGGAGFIGSHLCERLVKEGHKVISLDNYFTGTPNNHVEGVQYREGHTKDIEASISESPDTVFHLGEYARTEKSFEDIELVFELNKTGTFAVLEFCRRRNSKLIYAGSSTKFADGGEGRNQSPYAWTKATNTELVKNYAVWFGLRYAIAYFYNVYGPREMAGPYGTLVRIFNELYRNGQPLTVVAPGTQRRNFTHVSDIVDGLIKVMDKGEGDGFGIGSPDSYSVQEVAEMFGGEIIMLPERQGNRMTSSVDTEKVESLGWHASHTLPKYINALKEDVGKIQNNDHRILIFTTTFHPIEGPAEEALLDTIRALPQVHFDIVTTHFSKNVDNTSCLIPNATVYRIGNGNRFDKYLFPIFGAKRAREIQMKNQYMFKWSLLASYGALAALFARSTKSRLPLLITLADQQLGSIPWYVRFVLQYILKKADQVYVTDTREAKRVLTISKRSHLIRSIGEGDAFANQLRFTYSNFLLKRVKKH